MGMGGGANKEGVRENHQTVWMLLVVCCCWWWLLSAVDQMKSWPSRRETSFVRLVRGCRDKLAAGVGQKGVGNGTRQGMVKNRTMLWTTGCGLSLDFSRFPFCGRVCSLLWFRSMLWCAAELRFNQLQTLWRILVAIQWVEMKYLRHI